MTGLALGRSVLRATAGRRARPCRGRRQPSQRRAGLLRAAAPAVGVPEDRARRAVQPARELHVVLQVDRPRADAAPALRPRRSAVGRGLDDHRRGRPGPVRGAHRDRLPGPRPVQDRDAAPAGRALGAVGSAEAVQRQAPHHPRIELRCRATARARRPSVLRDRNGVHAIVSQVPDVDSGNGPQAALGRGFAVLSTALDNNGHNCNIVLQAESLVMAKEHFIETYGPLRYTIASGCSGGAVAQQQIANAYPGVYQGLMPQCSYPDSLSAGQQFSDYHLLRKYFESPERWGPGIAWSPTQFAAVEGHLSHVNAITADEGLFKDAASPDRPVRRSHRRAALPPRDEPARGALLDPGLHDQCARPAAAGRVGRRGTQDRPRLRGGAARQRGRPVRARRAGARRDHHGPVRRRQRADRSHQRRPRRASRPLPRRLPRPAATHIAAAR